MTVLRTAVRSMLFLRDAYLDLLFPPHCILSGEPLTKRTHISQRALDACDPAPDPVELMLTLQRHAEGDETFLSSLHALYSVGTENGIDNAIYAIKYKGRTQLAEMLSEHLGQHCLDKGLTADVIVPVPIHRARKRERGYNQAWHIAIGVGAAMNIPVEELLVRNRNTASQTTLSDAQRQSNVSSVFSLARHASVRGKRVMLVDDVLTTGATMNRCAEVLLEAGASRVDAIAIGATV